MAGSVTEGSAERGRNQRDTWDESGTPGSGQTDGAGSDDSPLSDVADTAGGGIVNSGPNEEGFMGSEEFASRGKASQEPRREAESGVPPDEAHETAPGDHL